MRVIAISENTLLAKDFALKDQLSRSSGSVMDNIAEGFERGNRNEFILFLGYAKGSAGEMRSQLHRCLDKKYISPEQHEELIKQSDILSSKLYYLLNHLKTSEFKGVRYVREEDTKYSQSSEVPDLNTEDLNSIVPASIEH